MRQKLISVTQSLRLPSICTLCNQFHKGPLAVCAPCIVLMPQLGPACQQCACPLADAQYLICGFCIKKSPNFDRAFITYKFEEPLRTLLHRFKYHKGLYLTSFLSHLIMNSQPDIPECLIPIPMHPQRMKQRGFNQAAVLAQSLAKKLKIPCELTACHKTINTLPQAILNGEQRQKNLRHAFTTQKLPYHHITLIDDLLTTGSTANEMALILKKTGIKRVDLWCCARATGKEELHKKQY